MSFYFWSVSFSYLFGVKILSTHFLHLLDCTYKQDFKYLFNCLCNILSWCWSPSFWKAASRSFGVTPFLLLVDFYKVNVINIMSRLIIVVLFHFENCLLLKIDASTVAVQQTCAGGELFLYSLGFYCQTLQTILPFTIPQDHFYLYIFPFPSNSRRKVWRTNLWP